MALCLVSARANSSVRLVHKSTNTSERIRYDGQRLHVPGYCREEDCAAPALLGSDAVRGAPPTHPAPR